MNVRRICLAAIAAVALLLGACNDPTDLGADLISDQFSDIQFTDTVSIRTVTIPQDSIFTYTNIVAAQQASYPIGALNDPIFGRSEASLYVDYRLSVTSAITEIDFDGFTIDSLVLGLALDSTRIYGDTLQPQTFRIYRLLENMDNTERYYSDQTFMTEATPVGEATDVYIRPRTDTEIIEVRGDDNDTTYFPQVRIRLDDALGAELLNLDPVLGDSIPYSNSETFQEYFKGLHIVPDPGNTVVAGFNQASTFTYLKMYYSNQDTALNYTFVVNDLSTRVGNFAHDYTGAEVEPFINDATQGDSLIFVQGLSGLNVRMDFPYIEDFTDRVVVNRAELEFTYAYIPGDDTITFAAPDRIVLTTLEESSGDFFFIEDVNSGGTVGDLDVFGGSPVDEDDNGVFVKKYRMNISNFLQDIIDNPEDNNEIYLQVFLKNQYASRGILYGPGHSVYPAKLHLSYTVY